MTAHDASSNPTSPKAAAYEFGARENGELASLAKTMTLSAFIVIAQGVFAEVNLAYVPLGTAAGPAATYARAGLLSFGAIGLLYALVTGIWTLSAAGAFRLVARTTGNDIPNLMAAIDSLRKYFTVVKWTLIVALVLCVVAIFGGFALGVMVAAKGH